MSHFKVLVIGEDVETQLAPYDENLETAPYQDDSFDYTKELNRARDFYIKNTDLRPELDRADDVAVLNAFHEGEDLRWNDEKSEASLWSSYNPRSKWDYWVIGGRYNANFKIKPGTHPVDYFPSEAHWSETFGNAPDHTNASDRARKRAIDFPAMIAARRANAEESWAKLAEVTKGIEPPTESWDEVRERHDDIGDARKEYHSHPWHTAARKAGFWDAYDDFCMAEKDPLAAYIARAEQMAVAGFYAIVRDGEWIARGDMGWFGMSDDKVDEAEWRAKVAELIESLPDDAWLTTVDCHI